MQIFTLNLVLNASAGCFTGTAIASLPVSWRGYSNPPRLQQLNPHLGQAALSRGASPAGSSPGLLLSYFHTPLTAVIWRTLGKVLTVFSSFPPKNKKKKSTEKKTSRILNLRRAFSITLYIITFNLLPADYKVFFLTMCFKENCITFNSKEHTQSPLIFTPAINFVH